VIQGSKDWVWFTFICNYDVPFQTVYVYPVSQGASKQLDLSVVTGNDSCKLYKTLGSGLWRGWWFCVSLHMFTKTLHDFKI